MEDQPAIEKELKSYEQAVGGFITRFNRIEAHLFAICVAALNVSHQKAAVIYYRNMFSARLSFINDLLQQHLTDPAALTQWDALRSSIKAIVPMRNMVAHGTFDHHVQISIGPPGQSGSMKEEYGAKWPVWQRVIAGSGGSHHPAITAAQINGAFAQLDILLRELGDFVPKVKSQPLGKPITPAKPRRKK